ADVCRLGGRDRSDSQSFHGRDHPNALVRRDARRQFLHLRRSRPKPAVGQLDSGQHARAGVLWRRISRIDVLVVDDWAMAPLTETERRDFWEICEERYQTRSVILTSQMPVARWHEQIGDPTVADGILDRLVHNAHRIEMRGDSMRKARGKPS